MPITPGIPEGWIHYEDSDEAQFTDGRWVRGVNKFVHPEIFEQYRQGYRCLACDAAQEVPFPKECVESQFGLCGFKIKDRQLSMLEEWDRGSISYYGPMPLEMVDEMYAEHDEEKFFTPRTGIWVPEQGASLRG